MRGLDIFFGETKKNNHCWNTSNKNIVSWPSGSLNLTWNTRGLMVKEDTTDTLYCWEQPHSAVVLVDRYYRRYRLQITVFPVFIIRMPGTQWYVCWNVAYQSLHVHFVHVPQLRSTCNISPLRWEMHAEGKHMSFNTTIDNIIVSYSVGISIFFTCAITSYTLWVMTKDVLKW